VVVEAHLAVGDDVESGIFLVGDRKAIGIVERLGVVDRLERHTDVAPAARCVNQLLLKPAPQRSML